MELKSFVQKVLTDVIAAVEEVDATSKRKVTLFTSQDRRTVEFDIAVTVEKSGTTEGEGEVKVLGLIAGSLSTIEESKNSSISRVQFGVNVDTQTHEEIHAQIAEYNRQLSKTANAYRSNTR